MPKDQQVLISPYQCNSSKTEYNLNAQLWRNK